jgi:hypothetical protein
MELQKTVEENKSAGDHATGRLQYEAAGQVLAQMPDELNGAAGRKPATPEQKRIRWVGARRSAVVASNNSSVIGCPLWNPGADWKCPLAYLPMGDLSPKGWATLLGKLLLKVLSQLPHIERVIVLREMAEVVLEPAFSDLEREERIQLMNALLPLVVRVVPQADLDLLAVFPVRTPSEHASNV